MRSTRHQPSWLLLVLMAGCGVPGVKFVDSTQNQTQACESNSELCNGKDDDCDGSIDEDAQSDCTLHVLNANSVCQSGRCIRLACLPGYYSCDGLNENGCEAHCPCVKRCDGNASDQEDAGMPTNPRPAMRASGGAGAPSLSMRPVAGAPARAGASAPEGG